MRLPPLNANHICVQRQKEKWKKIGLKKRRCWDESKRDRHNMSPPSSSLARKIVEKSMSSSIIEG